MIRLIRYEFIKQFCKFSILALFVVFSLANGGLGLDFIVKHSVFHTQTGFARLKNSNDVFLAV